MGGESFPTIQLPGVPPLFILTESETILENRYEIGFL